MDLRRNIYDENVSALVAFQYEGITVKDMVNVFNKIVEQNAPIGKTADDFTGGYIQQMSNSNQLVLYYGYKFKDGEKTGNKDTTILDVDDSEIDMFYIGLKAKTIDMRLRKKKGNKKKVSMMDIFSSSEVEPENKSCDAEIIPETKLVEYKCKFCGQLEADCDC